MNIDRKVCMDSPSEPLLKFSANRTLSCAMKLDIIPWCLIINSLAHEIIIVDSLSNEECLIQSNSIAIPITIKVFIYAKFIKI